MAFKVATHLMKRKTETSHVYSRIHYFRADFTLFIDRMTTESNDKTGMIFFKSNMFEAAPHGMSNA